MLNFIYKEARAMSVYSEENFPKIQECVFKYFPPAFNENGCLIAPPMVRVVRDWPNHRLNGEFLGDIDLF